MDTERTDRAPDQGLHSATAGAGGFRATASQLDSATGGGGADVGFGRLVLYAVIDLGETLDGDALEAAVAGVVRRFPVLGCRYVHGFWRDRWVAAPELAAGDAIEVRSDVDDLEAGTLEVVARELEPADHWPWRVTQLVGADRSRLVITLLHQAGDGASLLAVTKELGLLLMRPDEERPPAPPERGLDLLARGKGLADLFRLLPALTREAFQPLAVPFIARTAPPYRHPVAGAAPTFVVREVTAEVGPGSALRDLCRELGCTVNDALVAAVAVLIGQISERGRIGAFFTANLRRYLDDDRPRVANLSSFDLVILARHRVNSLAEAMLEVSRRIRRKKRRIPGLVLVLGSAVLGAPIPFGLARALGRLLSSGMRHLATRGVMVTNIGPMDHALAPFGERVTAASVIGPFLHGHQIPIITATSFRGRLSLAVNGFDDTPEERWQQIVSVLSRALTGLD